MPYRVVLLTRTGKQGHSLAVLFAQNGCVRSFIRRKRISPVRERNAIWAAGKSEVKYYIILCNRKKHVFGKEEQDESKSAGQQE